MASAIKRVLAYMAVMAACFAIALFTTETRAAFIAVFATGLAFGLVAELLFWIHIVRLTWSRRRQ